jgi:predicted metal-binding protein
MKKWYAVGGCDGGRIAYNVLKEITIQKTVIMTHFYSLMDVFMYVCMYRCVDKKVGKRPDETAVMLCNTCNRYAIRKVLP